jgi:hypothetical protein
MADRGTWENDFFLINSQRMNPGFDIEIAKYRAPEVRPGSSAKQRSIVCIMGKMGPEEPLSDA